jgi:uncharacterized membrane protein YvbJ
MALIKCKKCGTLVSSQAKKCIKCNSNLKFQDLEYKDNFFKVIEKIASIILIISLIILFFLILSQKEDDTIPQNDSDYIEGVEEI